jgi:hypothetical protein
MLLLTVDAAAMTQETSRPLDFVLKLHYRIRSSGQPSVMANDRADG